MRTERWDRRIDTLLKDHKSIAMLPSEFKSKVFYVDLVNFKFCT